MPNELSYWEKSTFFYYDIVLIGSGIVGLNAAISLKISEPLLKIAILESGFLPSGASSKNAGFACFGSISELIEQESICGPEELMLLVEKRLKGLSKLRAILGDSTIDYKPLGGYELFTNNDISLYQTCVSKIEHYNQLIEPITGAATFSVDKNKISQFGFQGVAGLITNKHEAQIDTGKMMFGLIQYVQNLGVTIFNSCEAEELINGDKLFVKTKQGNFSGKRIVVTTNAFVNKLIPDLDVKPGRGQVLITKPVKDLKFEGTFHYDKGYYYFRNINNRVLLGGGRNLDFATEETTTLGLTSKIQTALEKLLAEVILPDTNFEIDYRWSGIMAFGNRLEPIVKETSKNIFCAVRCSGMGVAMGSQTGEDVAQLVLKSL